MRPRAWTLQDPRSGDPELDCVLSPPSPHPKLASTLVMGCGEASQGGVLCWPHHAGCPGSAEPEPGSVHCLPGYSAVRGRASVQSALGRCLPGTDWMWRARLGAWHCCLTPLGCSPVPLASHTELLGPQDRSTPRPHPATSAPLLHGPLSPSALEGLLCPLVPWSGDPRQVPGPYCWEGPGELGPCACSAQPGLGAGSPTAGEGLSVLRERRPGAGPGVRWGQDRAGIHRWRGCPSHEGRVFWQISQCGEAQG